MHASIKNSRYQIPVHLFNWNCVGNCLTYGSSVTVTVTKLKGLCFDIS